MKDVGWEIALRIRDSREQQGYTREVFEEKSEVSAKFLYEVETARKDISAKTLIKICKALNVSSDYILFGQGNKEDYSQLLYLLQQLDNKQIQLVTGIVELMVKKN